MLIAAILVVFPLCLIYAAFSDMFTMTIPNRISVVLIASFVVIAPFTDMSAVLYAKHFVAAIIVFSICFALFGLGMLGGGDAKLLTAASLWFGLDMQLFNFLIYVAMFGGLLSVIILVARSDRFSYYVGRIALVGHLTDPKLGVPYGIAIGAAGVVSYPTTPLMQYAMAHLI